MSNLVKLGSCKKPHGIKGGFSFHLFTADESVLKKGMSIILTPLSEESSLEKEGQEYKISSIKLGQKTIAYLKSINDRNIVESMIPFDIFLKREDFPETRPGEFYIEDLVGLEVFDYSDKSKSIGIVKGHFDNGAQTVLEIRGKVDIDLPFVEHFFPDVELDKGVIWVKLPEVIE